MKIRSSLKLPISSAEWSVGDAPDSGLWAIKREFQRQPFIHDARIAAVYGIKLRKLSSVQSIWPDPIDRYFIFF